MVDGPDCKNKVVRNLRVCCELGKVANNGVRDRKFSEGTTPNDKAQAEAKKVVCTL